MNEILQHYLYKVLPYRLYAIGAFEMALNLVAEYPKDARLECRFDEKVKIIGSSTTITNPTIEMGIIHARVLLEFLGLKARTEKSLISVSPRNSDISIESFGLTKLTVEQALSLCGGDKSSVEEAIAKTLTLANKLVAHSTFVLQLENDSIGNHLTTCMAIRMFFAKFFYKELGEEMPDSFVEKCIQKGC